MPDPDPEGDGDEEMPLGTETEEEATTMFMPSSAVLASVMPTSTMPGFNTDASQSVSQSSTFF